MNWNDLTNLDDDDITLFRRTGIFFLACAVILLLWKVGCVVDRHVGVPRFGRPSCPPRVLTYCVKGWWRHDSWNIRSRWAIGQAARTWNNLSRFRFKETVCSDNTRVAISFERGPHEAGHSLEPFARNMLAHATFPGESFQYVHVNDDYTWAQASDGDGRGHDLAIVMTHEFGHLLGLEHLDTPGTLMRPYRYQHLPGFSDEDRVRALEERCLDEEHEPIEVRSPGPGETWYAGRSYRISWRSELPGPLRLGIYRQGQLVSRLTTEAHERDHAC